jgi:hypothetical protein
MQTPVLIAPEPSENSPVSSARLSVLRLEPKEFGIDESAELPVIVSCREPVHDCRRHVDEVSQRRESSSSELSVIVRESTLVVELKLLEPEDLVNFSLVRLAELLHDVGERLTVPLEI